MMNYTQAFHQCGCKIVAVIAATLFAVTAHADRNKNYEVTITNITKRQTFTPQLVATHDHSVELFALGEPASLALEILAEAGDTAPLMADLQGEGRHVSSVQTIPSPLGPGESVSLAVETSRFHRQLSVAAMLIPTNDTFMSLVGASLPLFGEATYQVPAYDAGTEFNSQNCALIPGPTCGGEGHSPGPNPDDEGYIYISNGFHDIGTADDAGNEILGPYDYDWRNPVAIVTVRRIR